MNRIQITRDGVTSEHAIDGIGTYKQYAVIRIKNFMPQASTTIIAFESHSEMMAGNESLSINKSIKGKLL